MREFSSELTGEISGKHANVDMQRTPEKIHLRSKVRVCTDQCVVQRNFSNCGDYKTTKRGYASVSCNKKLWPGNESLLVDE
jgi:hypothetical protein